MMKTEQGPGYGAVMLAMVGCGLFPDVQSAAESLVSTCSTVMPETELVNLYNERYSEFRQIYPALKPVFKSIK